mmetsp:Transcript_5365/g.4827  ORF Transcript_5365/g.4827 Transcript_5365/m.4827 type:complete len:96 (+) Transcript_5365:135-422(+)
MNIANKRNLKVMENFLGFNPDVNIQDNFGNTVFMNAVKTVDVQQLKLLNRCNDLNVNIINKNGHTAVALANQLRVKKNLTLVTEMVNYHFNKQIY